jgi:GTPase SAR1 family protein
MAVAQKIGAKHYIECSARTGEGVREVFQYATRQALLVPHRRQLPPKRTVAFKFKQLFKPDSKSKYPVQPETERIDPLTISSEDAKVELENFVANSSAPKVLKTFRLLVVGKTGCGKTTILTKVTPLLYIFRKRAKSATGMRREHGT